ARARAAESFHRIVPRHLLAAGRRGRHARSARRDRAARTRPGARRISARGRGGRLRREVTPRAGRVSRPAEAGWARANDEGGGAGIARPPAQRNRSSATDARPIARLVSSRLSYPPFAIEFGDLLVRTPREQSGSVQSADAG